MKRQIFISKDNQPHGPFNDEELGQKLIIGEIETHTLACEEGAPAWKPVSEVLDPQFVSKVLEFRRASQALSASMAGSMVPQPARPQMPAMSVLEPDGRPVQVPGAPAPSMVLTSLPMPAQPGAMAPTPGSGTASIHHSYASGASVRPSAPVSLAEETVGREPAGQSAGRPRWQIFAGAAAVLAVVGAAAWGPVSTRLKARSEFSHAQAALAGGRFAEAMVAARAANMLMPDSAIYLNAWQEARRRAIEDLKAGAVKGPALDYLVSGREFLTKYDGALGEEGLSVTRGWLAENEPAALQQVKEGFDGDMPGLTALLSAHEGKLSSYFTGKENLAEARRLHDQWQALRNAYKAWEANQQIEAVELMAKVPEDLQKGAAFTALQTETQQLRDSVLEKLHGATDLAAGKHFIEAMPILDELDVHARWVPEIKQQKQRLQLSGENYYAAQLVGAVRAKNAAGTRENLKNYMQYRRRPLTDAQLTEFLETRDFTGYLSKLNDYGLRPRGKAARQNYADVVLIASNLPNFTNPDEARSFLATAYSDWAKAELEQGRSSPACYLALLAGKYGHATANELFETAHEKILAEFTFAIRAQPLAINAPKASKSFGGQVELDALNAIRNTLPGWLKWQTPENTTAGEPEPLTLVKFTPLLAEFNRRNDRVARNATGRYKFPDIIEDNPEWYKAQEQVSYAQNALAQAQSSYAQAKASADSMAATAANDTSGVGLFGALMGTVVSAVSDGEVQKARQELSAAQGRFSRTPARTSRADVRDLNWTEFDFTSDFSTTFKLEFKVGDKAILSRALTAATQHKSMERESAHNGVIAAVQRQEPNLDEIESALLEKIRPQVQALGTPAFLGQLKGSFASYIAQQSGTIDAEAQANALIGFELLWWKHPLFNAAALRSPDLLGRFGDVIN